MGSLVLTLIAGVFAWNNLITLGAFIVILLTLWTWSVVAAVLYFKFGVLKFFYHDLLGWHMPDGSPKWSDGLSEHAICKHCGKEIMQDSQGNWFAKEEYK